MKTCFITNFNNCDIKFFLISQIVIMSLVFRNHIRMFNISVRFYFLEVTFQNIDTIVRRYQQVYRLSRALSINFPQLKKSDILKNQSATT